MKARLFDISSWTEDPGKHTEGTRDKRILISPGDKVVHYFKTSIKKENLDYKMEFWSEVIASYVGRWLGFDMAEYDVAILNKEGETLVGCLSPSIYDQEKEDMLSGYNLIVAYDETFKSHYKQRGYHSLERIAKTLKHHKIEHLLEGILACWLFDFIIGNGDRHSENWAIVFHKKVTDMEQNLKSLKIRVQQLGETPKTQPFLDQLIGIETQVKSLYRLGKIYDSGSSLGRELTDEKVKQMLQDETMLTAYLNRARGDISVRHLQPRKSLEDLEFLLQDHAPQLKMRLSELRRRLKKSDELRDVILKIDEDISMNIPQEYRLSQERKELIFRLIHERTIRLYSSYDIPI